MRAMMMASVVSGVAAAVSAQETMYGLVSPTSPLLRAQRCFEAV